jgi:imidazolonepropionase-like amidohydrolase
MDLIYHASYLDERALEAVIASGAALCPTFTLLGNLADYGHKVGSAPELVDLFRAEIETTGRMVGEAHRAGVPVLAGSETGFAVTPCGEWHARELELLVESCGFSPMEAIVSATRNGAIAMRMEDKIGTIEPGRAADILIVDGDPTRDVRILQDKSRIREVIARGRRADLVTPLPERKVYSGEKVRFLAACPLTQSLAFTDDQLRALSQV